MSQTITEKNVNVSTKKTYFCPTFGADPELTLIGKEGVVNAASVLKDPECSELGHDGNQVTFEVRPEPSTDPIEIVHNIRGLFVRQVLKNPKFLDYQWLGGTWKHGYPLGGHIHVGAKSDKINPSEATKILSNYVGFITLLLENKDEGLLRRKGGYGGFDDNRTQPYGFEYRAPSSWLVSPHITTAVLCLSKMVIFEVLNNDKFKPSTRVTKVLFSNEKEKELYEIFPEVWREITQMMLYQKYKMQVDPIYFLITKKRSWYPNKRDGEKPKEMDIKEAWSIVDMRPYLVTQIKLDSIWSKWKIGNMVMAER